MNPYVTPACDPTTKQPQALEVKLMRALWKQKLLASTDRIWPKLRRIFGVAYLIYFGWLGMKWLHRESMPQLPLVQSLAILLLLFFFTFLNALNVDDRRRIEQARSILARPPLAVGKASRVSASHASLRGSLFLSENELIFRPRRVRHGGLIKLPLGGIRAIASSAPGLLTLIFADGRAEDFRTGCPDLWRDELESVLKSRGEGN